MPCKGKNIDMDEKNIDQWSIILPQSDRGSKLSIYANCVTKWTKEKSTILYK